MTAPRNDNVASRDRRLHAWALVVVLACIASLPGCGDEVPSDGSDPAIAPTRAPEPVDTDLAELHERGTLRVMLRNSSSSYYILRGGEYGFEYELATAVADSLDLRLRVVLPDSATNPVHALLRGDVDVIAMPLPDATNRLDDVRATVPYDTARDVIVTRAAIASDLRSPDDLAGRRVAARRLSSGEHSLFELRRAGIPVGIVMHAPQTATDGLLDLVADGTYPAAATDDRALGSALRFRPNLAKAFEVGESRTLHWLVRSGSENLRTAIDEVLARHFRPRADGTHAGSEFYNVIDARYFADESQIRRHADDPFRLSHTGRVSPFDDLFRAAADSFDLDWRLLASIAFQESRFDPSAESWAGAFGLMQVKPATAGMDAERLLDAETNIMAGAAHLRMLLDLYDYVPRPDRQRLALAAYNCGQGHLNDARILSLERYRDPNRWIGSVRESLLLLRKPQYYREARYGYVRGNETVAYVREIERRYDMLSRLATPARREAASAVTWDTTR